MVEFAKVRGFKELDRELKKFPLKFQRKALTKGVRAGANVFKKEVKLGAVSKFKNAGGSIARNIKIKKLRRSKDVTFIIGVEHGKVRSGLLETFKGRTAGKRRGKTRRLSLRERRKDNPHYFRFQELGFYHVGTRKRSRSRLGRVGQKLKAVSRGRFVRNRFIAPAFNRSHARATEAVRKVLAVEIENYKPEVTVK